MNELVRMSVGLVVGAGLFVGIIAFAHRRLGDLAPLVGLVVGMVAASTIWTRER